MKKYSHHKAAVLKYVMLSVFVFLAASGQEAGCPGGPSPLPPNIFLSYTIDNDMVKLFFAPSEKVVISNIKVTAYGLDDNIVYGYPFISAQPGQTHYINQYSINGPLEFLITFNGTSRTTGAGFSVQEPLIIGR